jgi:hypothetical protein
MMRFISMLVATAALGGCSGGFGLTGMSQEPVKETASLERANTPQNRLLQVSLTAARASYCAFGMDRAKLKADYLAYERSQGASQEMVDKLSSLYDSTYNLFYNKVRANPKSCSREDIEAIRPDINRHLAGDFTPSQRKPESVDSAKVDVSTPIRNQDRVDITKGGVDNQVFQEPGARY